VYEYKAKVIKVIDGDTADVDIDLGFDIILSNQRIRFMGVDTPESRTSDKEEKVYGLLAKDFVQSHLVKGDYVTLQTFKDDRGKFGRVLGDFKVYDTNNDRWTTLCRLLIENNLGVAYHGQSKDDIKEEHLRNRQILSEKVNLRVKIEKVNLRVKIP
jgi:micrococcal nuclease